MPNEDLEKTTEIETLDDLSLQIKEMAENPEELDNMVSAQNNQQNEEPNKGSKEKKKFFAKIKNWWNNLTKNKKVMVIIGIILLIIALGVCIFFVIKSLESNKPTTLPKENEDVIVEQENYRYENGKLIFLNADEEEIGSYECENKDEDLCYVSYYSTEDNFDVTKRIHEDETIILERTPIVNDNFVFINDNKENGDIIRIYDIKEEKCLEETYRIVKKADTEGTSFILKNSTSTYGVVTFVETEMMNVLPFSYDYLGFIPSAENYYISLQANRNVIINSTGKNLSKGISGTIKGLTKKYIKTIDESGKYSVYDYNGKEIFTDYDYIELYDEYAALINEKKMTLKFYDGAKLNEEEIKLKNTNYVKTNVYDEENVLKETKESFYLEENNNTINIHIVKDEEVEITTLNKLEGLRSKTIKYANYFNGILYFYRDEEKTDLLGTYKCNNKNQITKIDSELTNCYIARDNVFENNDVESGGTNSMIPVFNERFVFVNDNPELVNDDSKTVVLYDLKKNSTISKYNKVNTYSYTGLEEISFKTVDGVQIVAKNKSNKFGVIKLGLSEVSAHIPFKYTAIEKIGDYYSVNDGNGYTLLSREDASPLLTNTVSGKIRNYNDNYVTGTENNLYYVYNHDGKKVNAEGYNYIALYNTFFAAVKDNKLSLRLYQNPGENFLTAEVPLTLTKYYGSGTLAFRVNLSGLNYTIEVGTSANTYEIKASGTIPTGTTETEAEIEVEEE